MTRDRGQGLVSILMLAGCIACGTAGTDGTPGADSTVVAAAADTSRGWTTITGVAGEPWEADSATVARYVDALRFAAPDTQRVAARPGAASEVPVVIEAVDENPRIGAADFAADGRVVFRVRLLDRAQSVESVGLGDGRDEAYVYVTREAVDSTRRAFRSVILARGTDGRLAVVRRGSVVLGVPTHDATSAARVYWSGQHQDAERQATRDSVIRESGVQSVSSPLFDPCFACDFRWCAWVEDA